MNTEKDKLILDYFRNNLYESLSSYSAWKTIKFSRAINVTGVKNANRYTDVQNIHPNFFMLSERCFLVSFIIMIMHSFDTRNDSMSLFQLNKEKTNLFVENNNETFSMLKKARHKIFAHRDLKKLNEEIKIPSLESLEVFLKNLIIFYNELSSELDNSSTLFENTKNVIDEIESMFENIFNGYHHHKEIFKLDTEKIISKNI